MTTTTTKRQVLSCGYELSVLLFSHVRQNRPSPTKGFDPNTLSGQAQSGVCSASRWDHGYIYRRSRLESPGISRLRCLYTEYNCTVKTSVGEWA